MRLTLLTCAAKPGLSDDDRLVAEALDRRGVDVQVCPWSSLEIGQAGDVAVLRSTWDYHLAFVEFTAWLAETERRAMPLLNPSPLVRWNASKLYLRDLAAAGVTLPQTVWLDAPDRAGIAKALAAAGWDRAVLKPCVSASAHATTLVTPDTWLRDEAIEPLRSHGALLQRYVSEIERRGELSVVFFDGGFSHAVLKRPRAGDFRVQFEFGGTETPVAPTSAERSFAERVLDACPEVPAYARVDIVTTTSGPVLMELELIEPVLFLASDADAPDRFARAILARS